MSIILLKNLALLDSAEGVLKSGYQVLVEDGRIADVAKGAINTRGAEIHDLGGRTLMPGLIDCHVHVLRKYAQHHPPTVLPSFVHAHVSKVVRGMLMRGFTTVRDAGGADFGHKQAIEKGLYVGPRLFVSGRAISQSGGHGDSRSRADLTESCGCGPLVGGISRVADGVTEVRRAVRDEIRLGADQLKIMAGGGVSSPADPIDQMQYSTEEMEAAVDEARRAHTYVLAHVYTAQGVGRAVEAGIRTIEHGNFLDEKVAAMMARAGAFLVPTLITYRKLLDLGPSMGRSASNMEKARYVLSSGTRSLEIAKRAGVKMAFGSDLLWAPEYAPEEFLVRAEALTAAEIIRSATVVAAEVLHMEGRLGVIAPDAYADLLAVDGNPLEDLSLFQDQGAHLSLILKDGVIYKDAIAGASAATADASAPTEAGRMAPGSA